MFKTTDSLTIAGVYKVVPIFFLTWNLPASQGPSPAARHATSALCKAGPAAPECPRSLPPHSEMQELKASTWKVL